MNPNDRPVACTLGDTALAARRTALRQGVLADAFTVERLQDGYRWQFHHTPDLLTRLGAVIDGERLCCRFLRFAIAADPDLGTVHLQATGPAGTADFLESWL